MESLVLSKVFHEGARGGEPIMQSAVPHSFPLRIDSFGHSHINIVKSTFELIVLESPKKHSGWDRKPFWEVPRYILADLGRPSGTPQETFWVTLEALVGAS